MTRHTVAPADPVIVTKRKHLALALRPPIHLAGAERFSRELADHIRNQHRVSRGLPPIVERWDRDAPEQVVTIEEVAA